MRGLTLVELLTGLVVTSVVLVAVVGGFLGVQGVYQREAVSRRAVEGTRTAQEFFEQTVSLAGFGLPPELAFDLTPLSGLPCTGPAQDNCTFAPTAANGLPQPVVTDDFAFRYRDPQYLRRASSDAAPATGGTLRLTTTLGLAVRAGQAFLLICPRGEWAAVRARASTDATATQLPFLPAGAPWPTPSAASCFQESGANTPSLVLVHERRLRVELLPPEGATDVRARPWLVLYHSLERASGCPTDSARCDFEPLVADVENFQVGWVMNRGPGATLDADGTQVLGDDPAVVPERPDPAAAHAQSAYVMAYGHAERFNAHPVNVRAVQLGLTVRTQRELPQRNTGGWPSRALGNWAPAASARPDAFYRVESTSVVRVPNLASRSFFLPALTQTSGDRLNTWGG